MLITAVTGTCPPLLLIEVYRPSPPRQGRGGAPQH